MTDIKELEKFESQFPYYGEFLMKILMKKPKDREFILEKLLVYLKRNPDVQVLSIRQIDEKQEEYRFVLEVKFKCSACKEVAIEETNLKSAWSPSKDEANKPVCEACMDRYREYAMDAKASEADEDDYLEREKEREAEIKSLPIVDKHEKN